MGARYIPVKIIVTDNGETRAGTIRRAIALNRALFQIEYVGKVVCEAQPCQD